MWGCTLGPSEASALMVSSSRKEERKKKLYGNLCMSGYLNANGNHRNGSI